MKPSDIDTDLSEKGRDIEGNPLQSDRRLYFQFQAFTGCRDPQPVIDVLAASGLEAALYLDATDPFGIGIAGVHEDPEFFTEAWRTLFHDFQFEYMERDSETTMFGRTYSIGYENDLDEVLLYRVRRRLADPDLTWAVWYPLRRSGEFAQLPEEEQREALMEHGMIGHAFSDAGHAKDVRLACYGMDRNDNDFVIGLLGRELHPLSAVVQTMRKTRQTSEFIDSLGPFFIGRKIWSAPSLLHSVQ